ncbi:MAG: tRNA (N(6)-L-threonylcarbamoyladenosine(37)-C(2))-methylthiotransferase MtaB [Bacteroidota bacterium]|nr:tRNA (N(6)-L-threonylcarbamoyladenosine(37)-C(2))-methylthiotransferase MtaB [Bacteroidota bacterium]
MKLVAFHTLGCKLNFAETSTIGRQFIENGFTVSQFADKVDVYVINTCSVSQRADRECKKIIRSAVRRSPDAFIIVTGCYAQLRPEEVASIAGVDLVLGTQEKFNLFTHCNSFKKNNPAQVFVSEIKNANDFGLAYSGEADERTRAFLKVQDGCDFQCSYCTIPLARGSSRSQAIETFVSQARWLAEKGYKEIVLSGVNVGDFGKASGTNLLQLLKELVGVDGIERIRVSSIEPNLLTEELVNFILESDKLCNHLHIPLQSGSNEVLRLMRRRHTREDFKKLITYIKSIDNTAGVGSDIIVGFPGETDELFDETYNFLLDLPLSYMHVFTYSERPNTPAASYPNSIQPKSRFYRNEKLRILSTKKRFEFYSQFVGKRLGVLYETNIKNGFLSGFSTNYIRVKTTATENLFNRIVPTLIKNVNKDYCEGDVIV